jgi:cardiolipin synthase C
LKPEFSDAVRAARDRGGAKSGGSRASLHAKTFMFDRQAIFIGSLNLDPRSIQINTEIGIVCESAPMAESMLGRFEPLIDRIAWRVERGVDGAGRPQLVWVDASEGDVRRLSSEPDVSAWQRFKVWLLGLLPIESQL